MANSAVQLCTHTDAVLHNTLISHIHPPPAHSSGSPRGPRGAVGAQRSTSTLHTSPHRGFGLVLSPRLTSPAEPARHCHPSDIIIYWCE